MTCRSIPALLLFGVLLTPVSALAAPDHVAIAEAARTAHIKPGYEKLAAAADMLHKTAVARCGKDGAVAMRQAFNAAMDAWQSVQHIRHGLINAENRHDRLQFWPDKRGVGERHLRRLLIEGTQVALTPSEFSTLSIAVQGFPALEHLLFDGAPLSAAAANGEALAHCDVAQAIALNIETIASELIAAEDVPIAPAAAEAEVRALLTDLVTGMEVVQGLKLRLPAGDKRPRPHLAENWRSGRSLRDVDINLHALRDLYQILYADGDPEDDMHKLILFQFEDAFRNLTLMGEDGGTVLKTELGPVQFRALAGTVQSIREMMIEALTASLRVSLGFNSLDGD